MSTQLRLLALAPAICMIAAQAPAPTAPAQTAPAQTAPAQPPPVAADLKAALEKSTPDELLRMADGGRADAQYYAGMLFLTGRSVARDPARGCAYAQKASASRADAMHLVGECWRLGLTGQVDRAKAEAAYLRAAEMGNPKSKCALGQMLMTDPQQASRGLALCKEAATAGDVDAQVAVADAYFAGAAGSRPDYAEARKWYEKAAAQNNAQAARRLGEMYARGDGGRKDTKKAVELWTKAEAAGDPMAPILVADQLFADVTGGKKPGPGTYAFKGGVPLGDLEVIESWYREARDRDPRPDVKKRAEYALAILGSLKQGGQVTGAGR
jgi:TPR repeat protein